MNIQVAKCPKCKESFLVGLNGKDVRRIRPIASGKLGDTPWIGIGNEQMKDATEIKAGDIVFCVDCLEACVVEDVEPVKKHEM